LRIFGRYDTFDFSVVGLQIYRWNRIIRMKKRQRCIIGYILFSVAFIILCRFSKKQKIFPIVVFAFCELLSFARTKTFSEKTNLNISILLYAKMRQNVNSCSQNTLLDIKIKKTYRVLNFTTREKYVKTKARK
jgi:hypothetical protein